MKYVIGFLLGLLSGPVLGQPAVFQGSIYSPVSKKPIHGVEVTIPGMVLTGVTDWQGRFTITNLPQGVYKARFAKPGYETLVREIVVEHPVVSIGLSMKRRVSDRAELQVVSPQRFPRDPFLSPGPVSHLTQLDIRRQAPLDGGEALAGQPGLWTYQPGLGQAALSLRGLSGQRVLMLRDGIRLSPLLWGDGPDSYLGLMDVNGWDRVEVIPGGGAGVPYGTDALGGAVQIFASALPFSDQGWQVHGGGGLDFRQGGQQLGGRGHLSLHHGRVALRAQGGNWQIGDRIAGGGQVLPQSGHSAQSAQGQLRVKLSPRQQLTLGYETFRQADLDRSGTLAGDSLTAFPRRDRQLAFARWGGFFDKPWLQEIEVTASWQQLDQVQERIARTGRYRQTGRTLLDTYGLTVVAHSQPNPYWHAVSGVEYYQDQAGHEAQRQPLAGGPTAGVTGWMPHTAQATHLAAYTLHTLDILKLRVHVGGRAQRFSLDIPENGHLAATSVQPLGFTGNIGGLYPLHPNWHLVTSFQTGFRAPNLYDLAAFGPFELGMATPTDSLDAERSLNSEIGLKAHTPHFSGSLMFYRTRISDLIDWVEGTYQGQPTYEGLPVYRRENTGEALLEGIEAAVEVPLHPAWALFGSFTYARGRYLTRDEAMRRIPPLQSRLGLRFASRMGIWSRLEWQHATRQDQLAVADRIDPAINPLGTPAWHVVNLQIGYDFAWGTLTLGIQNLLDEYYVRHGSWLPEAGRTFLLSAQVRF